MSELLGLSRSRPAPVAERLRAFARRGGELADNTDGWGLAFVGQGAFSFLRATEAAATSRRYAALADRLVSDLVLAQVRRAHHPAERRTEHAQPCMHEVLGTRWVFVHNGPAPAVPETGARRRHSLCRLRGGVDAGHGFCRLLATIADVFRGARGRPAALGPATLAQVGEAVRAAGRFDFLLSDGEWLIAYGHDRLYRLECHRLSASGGYHEAVVASAPLSFESGWRPLAPGELRIYWRGRLLYRAHGLTTAAPRRIGQAQRRRKAIAGRPPRAALLVARDSGHVTDMSRPMVSCPTGGLP